MGYDRWLEVLSNMGAMIGTGSTPTTNSATGGSAALANLVHVTADTPVVAINFYVAASVTPPDRVYVWNVDTGNLLQSIAIVDTPVTGWNQRAIDPFTLVAGTHYAVGMGKGADWAVTYWSSSPPALSSPYVFDSCKIVTPDGVSPAVPAGASSAALIGVGFDDGLSGGDGGGTGSTNVGDPTYTGDLQAWLSSSSVANLHQDDGLPWQTHEEVTDAGHGLSAIKTQTASLETKVGSAAGLDFASLFAGINELWTRTATLLTDSATLLARIPSTIGDSLIAVGEALGGAAGGAIGAISGRSGFPTVLWTLVDEVDFVQAKSWDVPADLYTLSTSDWPVNIRQVPVDGAPWRPRLGWWATRNGDLLGARRFVDWEASYLEDGGRRMPGIVVWLEPNTAGTLQAWRLT